MNLSMQTITEARGLLGDHADAERITARLLVSQFATRLGLPPIAWPALPAPPNHHDVEQVRERLAALDMTDWDMTDVSAAYEQLMNPTRQRAQGAYYTPPEVAKFMVHFSIGPQLERLAADPDPANVLQVLATDPACGTGVFLVEAARLIAARYCQRLIGETTPLMMRLVMPEVMSECVFGMDIDPIAIDLAKAALWIELNGEQPITYMDRNIICCNPLDGPHAQPPKLAERLGETTAPELAAGSPQQMTLT